MDLASLFVSNFESVKENKTGALFLIQICVKQGEEAVIESYSSLYMYTPL